ncbi:unnamed protein product [Orchesella dallaii]|uniref:Uncharacterized protein n=1 Tax=Orchesella dallaii TaxID=48710 RepID=A0ABP1S1P7_9HEXA
MGRRTDNQKAIAAVKEASGSQKLNKRKRQEHENMKLSSFLLKHLKRTTDSSYDQTTSEPESFQDQGSEGSKKKNVARTSDDTRVEACTSLNDECLEKVESLVSHKTYSENQDGCSKDLKNDDHNGEGCADSSKKCQVVTKILTETAVTFAQSPDSATSKNIVCQTMLCCKV